MIEIQNYEIKKFFVNSKDKFVVQALENSQKPVFLKGSESIIDNFFITQNFKKIKKEYEILMSLDHKNILKPEKFVDYKNINGLKNGCYMVLPGIKQDLFTYLNENFPCIDFLLIKKIFKQITETLVYLHQEKKRIHSDIRLQNILLDKDQQKSFLIDFEFSYSYKELENQEKILEMLDNRNPRYLPPEIYQVIKQIQAGNKQFLQQNNFNWEAYDVFSLGVSLFASVFYTTPFKSGFPSRIDEQYQYIYKQNYQEFWRSSPQIQQIHDQLLKVHPEMFKSFKNLIQQMISYDDQERITLNEIINSEFIQN